MRAEVISRAELERTHARTAAEALRHVPGVFLRDIHGKNGQEVWLQGMDSDRVLILVDGRPVTASTGSTVDLAQLSIGGVERIEIVKGAVSALYGSSAMGGIDSHDNHWRALHMYIAMNRFKIRPGKEEAFEEVWRNRESNLDEMPGFRQFHLLKGPVNDEYVLY